MRRSKPKVRKKWGWKKFTTEEMQKVKQLYGGLSWRLAKKCLFMPRKVINGVDLKPGDMISTCLGWNQRIAKIYADWRPVGRRGWVIIDWDIITEDGSSHSLTHCCTFPLETQQEIVNYWLSRQGEEYEKWAITWYGGGDEGRQKYENSFGVAVVKALKAGEEVFLPDGTIDKKWNDKFFCRPNTEGELVRS